MACATWAGLQTAEVRKWCTMMDGTVAKQCGTIAFHDMHDTAAGSNGAAIEAIATRTASAAVPHAR